jgi:ABC-type nitrate/sulfonate/bicarbonate transport system permease component
MKSLTRVAAVFGVAVGLGVAAGCIVVHIEKGERYDHPKPVVVPPVPEPPDSALPPAAVTTPPASVDLDLRLSK